MKVKTREVLEMLREKLPDAELSFRENPGKSEQHSILVAPESMLDVCKVIRDTPELAFDLLTCVTGIDWAQASVETVKYLFTEEDVTVASGMESSVVDAVAVPRKLENTQSGDFFEVMYHFYSTSRKVGPLVLRVRTKDRDENVEVPSVVSVFRSAEFQEREIFDLFGVKFTGHPDLRRILMWDEFEDFPMRKDYVAPDDYDYEPTPHDAVLDKAKKHYPANS